MIVWNARHIAAVKDILFVLVILNVLGIVYVTYNVLGIVNVILNAPVIVHVM